MSWRRALQGPSMYDYRIDYGGCDKIRWYSSFVPGRLCYHVRSSHRQRHVTVASDEANFERALPTFCSHLLSLSLKPFYPILVGSRVSALISSSLLSFLF